MTQYCAVDPILVGKRIESIEVEKHHHQNRVKRIFVYFIVSPSSFASCICLRMGENEEKITIEIQLVTVFVLRC